MSRRNKSRRQGERTTASDPVRVSVNQKMPRGTGCITITLSAVALGFGLLLVHMTLIDPLNQSQRAKDWKPVPCMVTESRIVSHRGGGKKSGSSFEPYAEFEYTHEDQTYTSSKFWMSHRLLNSYAEAKTFLEPFPKDKPAQCWMNPQDPSEAVLNRDFTGISVIGALFGSALAIIGVCGLFGSFWLLVKRS
jgi:hypothetical protein